MDTVLQLVDIYLRKEHWHEEKLSTEEAIKYFQTLIEKGNIAWHTDKEGMVIGYIEWWCVSQKQLTKILNNTGFYIGDEDITTGTLCYVNDVWMDNTTNKRLNWQLYKKLQSKTRHCEYYIGEEVKRGKRLRIRRNKDYGKREN